MLLDLQYWFLGPTLSLISCETLGNFCLALPGLTVLIFKRKRLDFMVSKALSKSDIPWFY